MHKVFALHPQKVGDKVNVASPITIGPVEAELRTPVENRKCDVAIVEREWTWTSISCNGPKPDVMQCQVAIHIL